ncbi:MAG: NADH-quinone oxidoreductase subunit F, partial [Christensenellaceae bacterium]
MIKNTEELKEYREIYKKSLDAQYKKVLVCAGTGCVAGGSLEVYARLIELTKEQGLPVSVELKAEPHEEIAFKKSGCHGFCEMGPLLKIEPQGWLYVKVKLEDCEEIVQKSLIGDEPIERLLVKQDGKSYAVQEDIPFYKKQTRIVLSNCGQTDTESIEEYIAKGGYDAVAKALFEMTPSDIVNEVKEAGLRGRGGGGYPAGRKWEQVAAQKEPIKYVVCNGDEGDPGAFMDRSIMEGDAHRMIEGMMIAGIAAGAHEGYVYVRAEYPLAVKRLQVAIDA